MEEHFYSKEHSRYRELNRVNEYNQIEEKQKVKENSEFSEFGSLADTRAAGNRTNAKQLAKMRKARMQRTKLLLTAAFAAAGSTIVILTAIAASLLRITCLNVETDSRSLLFEFGIENPDKIPLQATLQGDGENRTADIPPHKEVFRLLFQDLSPGTEYELQIRETDTGNIRFSMYVTTDAQSLSEPSILLRQQSVSTYAIHLLFDVMNLTEDPVIRLNGKQIPNTLPQIDMGNLLPNTDYEIVITRASDGKELFRQTFRTLPAPEPMVLTGQEISEIVIQLFFDETTVPESALLYVNGVLTEQSVNPCLLYDLSPGTDYEIVIVNAVTGGEVFRQIFTTLPPPEPITPIFEEVLTNSITVAFDFAEFPRFYDIYLEGELTGIITEDGVLSFINLMPETSYEVVVADGMSGIEVFRKTYTTLATPEPMVLTGQEISEIVIQLFFDETTVPESALLYVNGILTEQSVNPCLLYDLSPGTDYEIVIVDAVTGGEVFRQTFTTLPPPEPIVPISEDVQSNSILIAFDFSLLPDLYDIYLDGQPAGLITEDGSLIFNDLMPETSYEIVIVDMPTETEVFRKTYTTPATETR